MAMASPAVVSPKFLSDLYGASVISHSPILAPITPGAQLLLMGSILVYNNPGGVPPDYTLRIIADAADIPNIYGILLETIDTGAAGFVGEVNASVDRKGSFRIDQLEVGAGADARTLIPQCVEKLRDLGIYLEGLAAYGR